MSMGIINSPADLNNLSTAQQQAIDIVIEDTMGM